MLNELNIDILLASLVSTAFSAIWFSKFGFGTSWSRAEDKSKAKKLLKKTDYIVVFVGHLLSAYIISILLGLGRISGFLNGDILDGVILGAWGWLGFSSVTHVLSAQIRKLQTDAVIIELGQQLIALIIIGAIVAY